MAGIHKMLVRIANGEDRLWFIRSQGQQYMYYVFDKT